jgi:hypothetical protein
MGVNLVAVGLGESKHAAHFGPRLAPGVTCLAHPTPEAHSAFGIGRAGADALLQPGLWTTALTATANGHVQGRATGDARTLSGTFVIDLSGMVRFAHYARFPGDDPKIEDLLRAAEALQEVETA